MTELTEKQIKTRWVDVKKQISERQLLAYRVGIPIDKWDSYMHSTPSKDEVNRIYFAIQDDRKNKTLRVKNGLSSIVGYRESVEFSKKSGVSDTYIRDIIEGKKEMAGYDIINRLEIFLSAIIPDFEPSLENPLSIARHKQDYIAELASGVSSASDRLKHYCYKLTEMARKGEVEKDWEGKEIEPTRSLDYSIKELTELKSKIDVFWQVYVEKKTR
jgi:transcriptional regulator with XRE-family HTH domain